MERHAPGPFRRKHHPRRLGEAMRAPGVRAAAALIVLTVLIGVVAVSGDGPIRERLAADAPSPAEGAVHGEFLGREGSLPAWLLWTIAAVLVFSLVCIARRVVHFPWRLPRLPRLSGLRWRRRARMERVLAHRELGRRVPEAPREYLQIARAALSQTK